VPQLDIHTRSVSATAIKILDITIVSAEDRRVVTDTVAIASIHTPEDAAAFAALSEEWISAYFTLEPKDREQIEHPFAHFVDPGGDVLLAREEERAIGCVAIEPGSDGAFELSKMAVTPSARGRGIGRLLLRAAIERARELGATSLFLGSNHRLEAAVGLYESAGFEHVPRERIGPMPYTRADVFMRLVL
jgi:GNAT superfamily N-acetyltransferase